MTDKQVESKIYQIELLNEFSMSVYNRLLWHVHKNKIDLTHQAHQENFIVLLFHQLEETLSLNLFKKRIKRARRNKTLLDNLELPQKRNMRFWRSNRLN